MQNPTSGSLNNIYIIVINQVIILSSEFFISYLTLFNDLFTLRLIYKLLLAHQAITKIDCLKSSVSKGQGNLKNLALLNQGSCTSFSHQDDKSIICSPGPLPDTFCSYLLCHSPLGEAQTWCKFYGGTLFSLKDKQKHISSSWGYLNCPVFPCEKWGRKILPFFWNVTSVLLGLAGLHSETRTARASGSALPSLFPGVSLTSSHIRTYWTFYSLLGNDLQWFYKDKRDYQLAKVESSANLRKGMKRGKK